MVVYFSFKKNGILLDLKTKHIVCYFFSMSCYAIYKLIK